MRIRSLISVLVCLSLVLVLVGAGCKGEKTATPDPNEPAKQVDPGKTPVEPVEPNTAVVEPAEADNPLAVTVDGVEITEDQIDELVKPQIEALAARAQNQNPAFLDQYRAMMRQQTLDRLIVEQLMDKKVAENNVAVTDAEVMAEFENIAASADMTLDEFKARAAEAGQTFDAMKDQVTKFITYQKLLEVEYPDEMKITDADAQAFYDENKAQFEEPEQTKASHILVRPDESDPNTDPNDAKAAALTKAEGLLKQLRDGADFAELAKATGGYPSAPRGGDLGFFKRGAMVPEFDKVAFELEVGKISDVVETSFGYHIIKVTEKKEAVTKTFEEAKEGIIEDLKARKQMSLFKTYVEDLKAKATIEYPPGKEPKAPAAPGPGGMPIQ